MLPFSCTEADADARRQNAKGDCEDCPPGTHGDGRGQSCVLCASGFYQDLKGQLECKSCTSGTCRSMFGATSNIDHFKTASLPVEFQNVVAPDTTTTTMAVGGVNIVKEDTDKAKAKGLSPAVETLLYTILSAIALSVVLFHRFLPMRFKEADVFFAGDHFVEDTVRCEFIVLCIVAKYTNRLHSCHFLQHAKRMLYTRLGAAVSIALPCIIGMLCIPVFGSNELLILTALVPGKC